MTPKEEADLERILTTCNSSIGNAEAFTDTLVEQLDGLDMASHLLRREEERIFDPSLIGKSNSHTEVGERSGRLAEDDGLRSPRIRQSRSRDGDLRLLIASRCFRARKKRRRRNLCFVQQDVREAVEEMDDKDKQLQIEDENYRRLLEEVQSLVVRLTIARWCASISLVSWVG